MTRAAEELNVSEPTLSRAIRQLVRELETKLFERRGRSIALTESGHVLLFLAREILKSMEGLEAEVKGVHQTFQPVRLVARAASCLIPGLLEEFTKQYPEISVIVIQNDIGNKYSPTVIVAAITSQINKAKLPTHVEIKAGEHGLNKDSVILLEQLRTVDKRRLRERIGRMEGEAMEKVNEALVISLGIIEF